MNYVIVYELCYNLTGHNVPEEKLKEFIKKTKGQKIVVFKDGKVIKKIIRRH